MEVEDDGGVGCGRMSYVSEQVSSSGGGGSGGVVAIRRNDVGPPVPVPVPVPVPKQQADERNGN
ncbi:hypothetical protein TWF225_003975 [Orbilia oligospora]|nr:hypothetical protein TWF225_003975 [Orbilia oligospora]